MSNINYFTDYLSSSRLVKISYVKYLLFSREKLFAYHKGEKVKAKPFAPNRAAARQHFFTARERAFRARPRKPNRNGTFGLALPAVGAVTIFPSLSTDRATLLAHNITKKLCSLSSRWRAWQLLKNLDRKDSQTNRLLLLDLKR